MPKILLIISLIFHSFSSFAYLGETSLVKKSNSSLSRTQSYSVLTTEENGITIKEYLNSSGQVFAVSWKGITHPDLQPIFGEYYTEFEKIKTNEHRGMHHYSVRSEKLVVEKSGRMRNVSGHAFVPDLLPQGFNTNEL